MQKGRGTGIFDPNEDEPTVWDKAANPNKDNLSPEAREELSRLEERNTGKGRESNYGDIFDAFSFEQEPAADGSKLSCIIRFDASRAQAGGLLEPSDVDFAHRYPERKQQSSRSQGLRFYAFEWMKENMGRDFDVELPIKELSKADLSQVTVGPDGTLSGMGRLSYNYNVPAASGQGAYNTVGQLQGVKNPDWLRENFPSPFKAEPPIAQKSSDGSTITRGRLKLDLYKFYNIADPKKFSFDEEEEDEEIQASTPTEASPATPGENLDLSDIKREALIWISLYDKNLKGDLVNRDGLFQIVGADGSTLISGNDVDVVDRYGSTLPVKGAGLDLAALQQSGGMEVYVLYPTTEVAPLSEEDMMEGVSATSFPLIVKHS